MNIAVVGCGFFAAHYGDTLPNHPELRAVAAFDIVHSRAQAFSKRYNIPGVDSYQAILDNPDIDIVVNLVSPASRVEVSRAALLAGKHVYSDKPLSLDRPGAKELIDLAAKQDQLLALAPSNHLGVSMQTLARLVCEDIVGTPQLVYVEINDCPIHNLSHNTWPSKHDALWPAETEFRVGCLWEHAGYAMDKIPSKELGADCCVAIIRSRSGVIARLTIGTIARRNRSMTITGNKGTLHIPEIWDDEVPIHFTLPRGVTEALTSSLVTTGRKNGVHKANGSVSTLERGIQIDTIMDSPRQYPKAPHMDVCLGPAKLASSVQEKRRPRMAADYAFHIYEILQALHDSVVTPGYREITSDFESIEPMAPLKTTASDCTISW